MLMVEEYNKCWTVHSRSYSRGNAVLGVPTNHVLYTIVSCSSVNRKNWYVPCFFTTCFWANHSHFQAFLALLKKQSHPITSSFQSWHWKDMPIILALRWTKFRCFPPVRWGFLDFMWVHLLLSPFLLSAPLLSSSPSSSSSSSRLLSASHPCQFYLPDSNREHLLLSVRCRTSTAMVCAQCSLPDPNHDQPRPVFATGPQPRSSALSVGCWTWTASVCAQCSLPDLNQPPSSQRRYVGTNVRKNVRRYISERTAERLLERTAERMSSICQKECKTECQEICQKDSFWQKNVRGCVRKNVRR